LCFTHVDPFEDTESSGVAQAVCGFSIRFTHVDPFEDTESYRRDSNVGRARRFTHVDPFEDTERLFSNEPHSPFA